MGVHVYSRIPHFETRFLLLLTCNQISFERLRIAPNYAISCYGMGNNWCLVDHLLKEVDLHLAEWWQHLWSIAQARSWLSWYHRETWEYWICFLVLSVFRLILLPKRRFLWSWWLGFLIISTTAITRLFLGTGLDTGSGRFARLGRDVLLTDSFVLLTVSINLEKEENVRFCL